MQFQLVIQFHAQRIESFDALVETEDELISVLEPQHSVDGHDFGSGQANIFIHTNDPHSAFEIVRQTLGPKRMEEVKAAFRDIESSEFEWLFPENESVRFEVL